MDKDYWAIKILISTKIRDKLKTGLKINSIFKSAQNPASFDTKINMSFKKDFVDSIVRIIPNNKCKGDVDFLLCNRTYSFMYDVKTTEPRQFPDLEMSHVDNFQVCISSAMEVQLQAWNFKLKGANEITHGYSFKLVSLYHIEDIQVS